MTQAWSGDVGMMSVVDGYNRAGTGSASVTVHGAGMGLVTYTGRAREGQTGCEATEWESETSVRCLESHGGRGSLRMLLTSGGSACSFSNGLTLDSPSVCVLSVTNGPGTGKSSIVVFGASFNVDSHSAHSRVGFSSSESSLWLSETSVQCRSAAGSNHPGVMLGAVVTAGVRVGSMSRAFTFNSPISSFYPANQPLRVRSGIPSLTIYGSDFGTSDSSAAGRVGHSSTQASFWISDSVLFCMVSAGMLSSMPASVTVSGAVDSATMVLSYDIPQVKLAIRSVQSSGTVLHAVGTNLGFVQASHASRLSQTACESTEWASDTLLLCKTSNSNDAGQDTFVVTAVTKVSSFSGVFLFEAGFDLSAAYGTQSERLARTYGRESLPSPWLSHTAVLGLDMTSTDWQAATIVKSIDGRERKLEMIMRESHAVQLLAMAERWRTLTEQKRRRDQTAKRIAVGMTRSLHLNAVKLHS